MSIAADNLESSFTTEAEFTTDVESQVARDLTREHFPEMLSAEDLVIVTSDRFKVTDPEFMGLLTDLESELEQLGPQVVDSVSGYASTGLPEFIGRDGQSSLVSVVMQGTQKDAVKNVHQIHDTAAKLATNSSGFEVSHIGGGTINMDYAETAQQDALAGESYGMPAALIILLIAFGAVAAAVIPAVLAVVAIVAATGALALLGRDAPWYFTVLNVVSMMGLAVTIDYSLFIVSRYREELRRGRDKLSAIAAAGSTASRTVFFSGLTVIFALLGLLLLPHTVFVGIAAGAIIVVALAVLTSLTLLPAILAILGKKIDFLGVMRRSRRDSSEAASRFWDWMSSRVTRRPYLSLVVASAFLILLASPLLEMRTGTSVTVDEFPPGSKSRLGTTAMQEHFGRSGSGRLQIIAEGDMNSPKAQGAIANFRKSIEENEEIRLRETAENESALFAEVAILSPYSSEKALAEANNARDHLVPALESDGNLKAWVGGEVAETRIDLPAVANAATPAVFMFILGLSFLLLTVMFRSIVLPIKAIIMNLLSVGAAYGALVLVFQMGYGAELLGFRQIDAVEAWLPLYLFAVLFGLSMDYQVFLLSRIREKFTETADNKESIRFGLVSTGRVITSAALIMVVVFAGFAAGHLSMLQQMGFGLAVAIFLDATIVRMILVPAGMTILGRANWWFPAWLEWLPRLSFEGKVQPDLAAGEVRARAVD